MRASLTIMLITIAAFSCAQGSHKRGDAHPVPRVEGVGGRSSDDSLVDGFYAEAGAARANAEAGAGRAGIGDDGGPGLEAEMKSDSGAECEVGDTGALPCGPYAGDASCADAHECKDGGPPVGAVSCAAGGCDVERMVSHIAASSDDAEEALLSGAVNLASSDLELVEDGAAQVVGLRFTHVIVPAGATLTNAFIELTVDALDAEPTDLVIRAEQSDEAATFAATERDISSRPLTVAGTAWSPAPWTVAKAKQQTPNLTAVVQEVISRPGWRSRNPLAIVIRGAGKRTASAFDGDPRTAAALVLEYAVAPPVCGDRTCQIEETCATCPRDCGGRCPATMTLAVIGDYGGGSVDEGRVATLVSSWQPHHLLTLGDNNYPLGEASTLDDHVGQFYSSFIGSYHGSYGQGSEVNRFWPALGNHDWYTHGAAPYLNYFTLPGAPGGERYYQVDLGAVRLFALDSDPNEPDGRTADSLQAAWLKDALGASTACWNIVFMHHAPYSSSSVHGSTPALQWPFEEWGADSVLAGHDHHYERLQVSGAVDGPGIPYFVNGLGGRSLYAVGLPLPASQVTYDDGYGAMRIQASNGRITYEFYNVDEALIDTHTVTKTCRVR